MDTSNLMNTTSLTEQNNGDNQPEMTPEQAEAQAMKFARECGKAVAKGDMSLTTFVEKILPFARVDRQWIKADQSKDLWIENTTARNSTLSDAFLDKVNPEGNSKAANGSKLRQPLKLANTVDYTEELLSDTLAEIARLRKAGETTKSPYPAFVDVCRVQLKRHDNRLTIAEISQIVCPTQKVSTELSKLEAAQKALKAAIKIREDANEPVCTATVKAEALVADQIAVLKQVALQVKARIAAVAAGLTVV
jgi:hypothetical protein